VASRGSVGGQNVVRRWSVGGQACARARGACVVPRTASLCALTPLPLSALPQPQLTPGRGGAAGGGGGAASGQLPSAASGQLPSGGAASGQLPGGGAASGQLPSAASGQLATLGGSGGGGGARTPWRQLLSGWLAMLAPRGNE
jgi:hypothetical protein